VGGSVGYPRRSTDKVSACPALAVIYEPCQNNFFTYSTSLRSSGSKRVCRRTQVCIWRQRCVGNRGVPLWLSRALQRAERQPHWRADTRSTSSMGAQDAEWGPAARCARSRAVACGCGLHAHAWLGGDGCALSRPLFTGMAGTRGDRHVALLLRSPHCCDRCRALTASPLTRGLLAEQ
jgi:hypothetical protein